MCFAYQILPGWANQIREMELTCIPHGRDEICIQNLVRKPKGRKRPLGRPKCKWKGYTKMDLK